MEFTKEELEEKLPKLCPCIKGEKRKERYIKCPLYKTENCPEDSYYCILYNIYAKVVVLELAAGRLQYINKY